MYKNLYVYLFLFLCCIHKYVHQILPNDKEKMNEVISPLLHE